VYEVVGSTPYPSAADVLYLLFYPVMLGANGVLPSARAAPRSRSKPGPPVIRLQPRRGPRRAPRPILDLELSRPAGRWGMGRTWSGGA